MVLILWIVPNSVSHLTSYEGDIEIFIIASIFMVSASVMLFLYNSNQILGFFVRIWSKTNRPTATLKTATSYPMKNKFRTGMTIYMFALVIFTITVMSMIIGMMSYNIETITQEQVGGLDVVGIANPNNPIDDIEATIEENVNLSEDDFRSVYSFTSGYIELEITNEDEGHFESQSSASSSIYGFDQDFADENQWQLDTFSDRYSSERETWQAVYEDPDIVILDISFSSVEGMGPSGPGGGADLYVDDKVTLLDPNGAPMNKTVVGFTKQFIIPGVFVSKTATSGQFNLTNQGLFLFDLDEGGNAEEMGKVIERELNVNAVVLTTVVGEFTSTMESFFNLFTAFMGLGLIVGIAGLGIITLRAVHERRQEVGMMRAIGFQKRNIIIMFFLEGAFITIVGIIIGVSLGIVTGYNLWYEEFRVIDYEFFIPWARILTISGIAFVATALFTIPPSYSASKVTPVDAIRSI